MLVLTRKLDEQILIGDDIKVTLLRVRGNTVRIGIEAPRDVRILRGELGPKSETAMEDLPGGGPPLSRREQAFAHPQEETVSVEGVDRIKQATRPQLFVGTVKRNGQNPRLTRAPLAGFVSAS